MRVSISVFVKIAEPGRRIDGVDVDSPIAVVIDFIADFDRVGVHLCIRVITVSQDGHVTFGLKTIEDCVLHRSKTIFVEVAKPQRNVGRIGFVNVSVAVVVLEVADFDTARKNRGDRVITIVARGDEALGL